MAVTVDQPALPLQVDVTAQPAAAALPGPGLRVRTPALPWTARVTILAGALSALGFGIGVVAAIFAGAPTTGSLAHQAGRGPTALAGGLAVSLAAAALVVLVLHRMTLGRLAAWAADLRDSVQAARGPLADPLNARATRHAVETVNQLLDRTRTPVP